MEVREARALLDYVQRRLRAEHDELFKSIRDRKPTDEERGKYTGLMLAAHIVDEFHASAFEVVQEVMHKLAQMRDLSE